MSKEKVELPSDNPYLDDKGERIGVLVILARALPLIGVHV